MALFQDFVARIRNASFTPVFSAYSGDDDDDDGDDIFCRSLSLVLSLLLPLPLSLFAKTLGAFFFVSSSHFWHIYFGLYCMQPAEKRSNAVFVGRTWFIK